MNKGILSFSSGCVINLDDLDDFPDYFQVITKLSESIKNNKLNQSYMNNFLDAQLEDLQHIPEYHQLMKQLTQKYLSLFEGKQTLNQKFIKFLLKIVKNYFTSYSLQQQEALPILQILSKQLVKYLQFFCDFWLAISRFAAYVQKHEQLIRLYIRVVNEKQIFKSPENSIFYIKSVDKILRFRAFRQAFIKIRGNKIIQNQNKTPYLDFKLSLYQSKAYNNGTKEQFKQFLKILPKENSKFVEAYIKDWQQKLANLQN